MKLLVFLISFAYLKTVTRYKKKRFALIKLGQKGIPSESSGGLNYIYALKKN